MVDALMEPNPFESTSGDLQACKPSTVRSDQNHPTSFFVSVAVVRIGTLLVCLHADGLVTAIDFFPFTFGPLLLAWIPMWMFRTTRCQRMLVFASLAYAIWFLYVYVDVFHLHPDANSVIGRLFVGFYSFPVLLILCFIAGLMHRTDSLVVETE